MIGKIIVASVVVLTIALVCYLFFDSGVFGNLKKRWGSSSEKLKNTVKKKEVELADGPVLRIREKPGASVRQVSVNRREFKIGSGAKNDLLLQDETVEECHAVIYKRLKGNHVYYQLINLSKTNPVQHYNRFIDKYEYLGYREGLELEARECFYIGNVKVLITEAVSRVPTNTEYFEIGKMAGKERGTSLMVLPDSSMNVWSE